MAEEPKDEEHEVTIEPSCDFCENFVGDGYCFAFPNDPGIPQDILDGKHTHQYPHPGDQGVKFKSVLKGYDVDLISESSCWYCLHHFYHPFCKAFPNGDGIPTEIREGYHDHRISYPGDHGIIFESAMLENEDE